MRLELLPDRDGYSISFSNDAVIENDLKGGKSAKRLDMLDVTYFANVQFTLSPERYNYFREFLATYQSSPQWFDVLLVIEPYIAEYPLRNYKAQIAPGSVKLSKTDGRNFNVGLTLECYLDDLPLTSTLYPVDESDRISTAFQLISGYMKVIFHTYNFYAPENIGVGFSLVSGNLRLIFKTYDFYAPENVGATFSLTSGSLRVVYHNYADWPVENVGATFSLISGSIKVVLISYADWPVENIGTTFSLISGSLV